MNSLSELNSFALQSLDITDNRPSGITIDRPRQIIFDKPITASLSVTVPEAFNITEIINYQTANVRFRLTIVASSFGITSISWPSLPTGVTLSVSSNQYTLSGITKPSQWEVIKNPIWNLPSNFSSYQRWFLKVEVIFYDSSVNSDKILTYNVYDPIYYYIAELQSISNLTSSIQRTTSATANIQATASLRCQFGDVLYANASLNCVPRKIKGTSANLTSIASVNVIKIDSFLTFRYTLPSYVWTGATYNSRTIGLTLYGVTNARINWGDGTSDIVTTSGTYNHTYSTSGSYKVNVLGNYTGCENKSYLLTRVLGFPDSGITKIGGLGTNLAEIPSVLPSSVTDLSNCFATIAETDPNFTNVGFQLSTVASWDVSNVTNMLGMFSGASLFNTDLSSWNVGQVTNMRFLFSGCSSFNQPLNTWNVSNVTNMSFMLNNATVFNQPLNSWNVSNVTTMESLFRGCSSFNQPLNSWNVSNVTNMSDIFRGCSSFNQPLNSWNVSKVTDMSSMFRGTTVFNQSLNSWDVSNVTLMLNMFNNSGFNQNISSWNTANVIGMSGMFATNTAFNQPLNTWNTGKVITMSGMFLNNTVFNQNISSWNTINVTDMSFMFEGATVFNQPLNTWNTSNVETMANMFKNSSFNQNIGSWNTSKVTNMSDMFNNNTAFNQFINTWCVTLIPTKPTGFDTNTNPNWTTAKKPVWGTCP